VAVVAVSIGGCGTAAVPTATEGTMPVPEAVIEFARAVNADNADGVAARLWFPGPRYPEAAPVPPESVPEACVAGELASFRGMTIDVGSIRAERRAIGAIPDDSPDARLAAEFTMAWFPVGSGEDAGRQFADFDGRIVIAPEGNPACDDAAFGAYGEPG
jgi:hypothetical protein